MGFLCPLSLLFGCYRFLLSLLSKSVLQIHNTCAVLECTMGAFCTHITDANPSPTVGTMTQTLCITDKLLAYVCTRKDHGYVIFFLAHTQTAKGGFARCFCVCSQYPSGYLKKTKCIPWPTHR